jgi:hypothetical protein
MWHRFLRFSKIAQIEKWRVNMYWFLCGTYLVFGTNGILQHVKSMQGMWDQLAIALEFWREPTHTRHFQYFHFPTQPTFSTPFLPINHELSATPATTSKQTSPPTWSATLLRPLQTHWNAHFWECGRPILPILQWDMEGESLSSLPSWERKHKTF